ncbi:DnaD domain-containing protein [Paenibacillus doosanensis]|uniref:DnaD domain-containing protein n=1 Tax=Paenibacillus doosanensis TaxID=1229154 RepID=UPI00217F374D|nr:DnaD domain-containing protein [Paenibacillus doosanensis]MCS7459322.1 DnaD domain-containing protein [Paenibacillus doosanensis]
MKQYGNEALELQAAFMAGWREGSIGIPYLLLKHYHQLKLTEVDVLLMIHVMAFMEKEHKEFPTLEELQERMSVSAEKVIASLQKLLKDGLLAIDEAVDHQNGIHYEKYNFNPLFEKLAACWYEQEQQRKKPEEPAVRNDIFSVFEKEFGRPLTPMELESITGWLDKDRYPEELIMAGLKEAVFAGKVHFRYIDRILLEWSRNRITTVEQAKEHSQKFRSMR